MNVSLKPELEQFITERVNAGQYTDASDIVNEALEVLRDQHQFTPAHETYLRQEIRKATDQLDQGHRALFSADGIIGEERQRLAERRKRKSG